MIVVWMGQDFGCILLAGDSSGVRTRCYLLAMATPRAVVVVVAQRQREMVVQKYREMLVSGGH